MAKMNLNLVLTNLTVVTTTKLGCDAVAMKNSGRGKTPALSSSWQLVLPRFSTPRPPYEPRTPNTHEYEMEAEPGNRSGSFVLAIAVPAHAAVRDTNQVRSQRSLRIVGDQGRADRLQQHRLQHDHDYPSQDRHDVSLTNGIGSMQPNTGLVFTAGNRK